MDTNTTMIDRENDILDIFMPSFEMRQYLRSQPLTEQQLLDIIVGAPVPLRQKAEYLWGPDKEETELALAALDAKPRELFLLFEGGFEPPESFFSTKASGGIFLDTEAFDTYEAVQRFLQEGEAENEHEHVKNDRKWDILLKSCQNDRGGYTNEYEYTLIDKEPCFFFRYQFSPGMDNFRYAASQNLNLPIPFEPGDILTIDCRPFAPPVTGLLLEKDDGTNCSPQILYRDPVFPDCWQKRPLKQGIRVMNAFGDACTPIVSPLYRMEGVDPESGDPDVRFLEYAYRNNRISTERCEGYFWITETGLLCRKTPIGEWKSRTETESTADGESYTSQLVHFKYRDEWERFPEWIKRGSGPDFYPHGSVAVHTDGELKICFPSNMPLMNRSAHMELVSQIKLDFGLFGW